MNDEDDFGIIGATLANAFHVERVVAHGGFAIVYRGIHGGFRAPIALKCLRIPEGMTEDQRNTFLERFREEGELLFRLSAAIPEIVRPLHIDAVYLPTGELMPFLALEWLEGEGFDQVIARARRERKAGMDLLSVVNTLRPVANALVRAHNFPSEGGSMCVVHRDLKPENLFLCNVAGAPTIKILDYGIAEVFSVAQSVSGGRGWGGMNPFTPGYGAPEQWAPDRYGASGPWTDVWGLALTMTEALAGKPAIDGEVEVMRRIALDPRRRPTPRALGVHVTNEIDRIFEKALAVDPRDRLRDIESFWSQLENVLGRSTSSFGMRAVAPPGMGPNRRNSVMELELEDVHHAIDLDLAVAPESLRNPPRAGMGSVPPARGAMGSVPPARGSMASMKSVPPLRAMAASDAEEEDLPMHDEGPLSTSGPRSVPAPRSSRPSNQSGSYGALARTGDGGPVSTRGRPVSSYPGPASSRGSQPGRDRPSDSSRGASPSAPPSSRSSAETGLRASSNNLPRPTFESDPGPVTQAATAVKGRYLWPAILLGFAIAITVADLVAVRVWGAPLSIGPVRSFWIAGPLALAGAVTLIWKIVAEDDDG